MQMYVIPIVKASDGRTVMEYRLCGRRLRLHRRFCKENEQHITSVHSLLVAMATTDVIFKNDRLIMPSAETARKFAAVING